MPVVSRDHRKEVRRAIAERVRSGEAIVDVALACRTTTGRVRAACHEFGVRWKQPKFAPVTLKIAAALNSGERQCEVAKRFRISRQRVSQIASRFGISTRRG